MMPTDPKYGGVPDEMIKQRDERYGINTQRKKQQRHESLTESFEPDRMADQYLETGKVLQFSTDLRPVQPK